MEETKELIQPDIESGQTIEGSEQIEAAEEEINNEPKPENVIPTEEEAEETVMEDSTDCSSGISKEVEKYFGNYPETLGMLSEDKEFKIGDETAVFLAMTEGYARGSGIGNPTIDKCLKELFSIGKAARNGGFTIDQLETVMKGLGHDSLLEKATREAELRGRNAAIEEEMPDNDELTSDGIPHLGAAQMRSPSSSGDSIFQLAQGAR